MIQFFEKVAEFLYGAQIAISPLLIFSAIGAVVYLREPTPNRLILAVILAIVGLAIGIAWAIHIHKKRGTVEFMSKLQSSQDMDTQTDDNQKKP